MQKPLTQLSARKKLISSRGDWGKELHHFSKTGGQTWDLYGFCLFSLSTAALGHCAPLNLIIFIHINCSALCKRPKNIFFSRNSTFSKSSTSKAIFWISFIKLRAWLGLNPQPLGYEVTELTVAPLARFTHRHMWVHRYFTGVIESWWPDNTSVQLSFFFSFWSPASFCLLSILPQSGSKFRFLGFRV